MQGELLLLGYSGGMAEGAGSGAEGQGWPRRRRERVQHAHGGLGTGEPACGDRAGTHRDKTVTGWDRVRGFACFG